MKERSNISKSAIAALFLSLSQNSVAPSQDDCNFIPVAQEGSLTELCILDPSKYCMMCLGGIGGGAAAGSGENSESSNQRIRELLLRVRNDNSLDSLRNANTLNAADSSLGSNRKNHIPSIKMPVTDFRSKLYQKDKLPGELDAQND